MLSSFFLCILCSMHILAYKLTSISGRVSNHIKIPNLSGIIDRTRIVTLLGGEIYPNRFFSRFSYGWANNRNWHEHSEYSLKGNRPTGIPRIQFIWQPTLLIAAWSMWTSRILHTVVRSSRLPQISLPRNTFGQWITIGVIHPISSSCSL